MQEQALKKQQLKDAQMQREMEKMREVHWPEREVPVPPRWEARLFNENDILGDFDRDSKGRCVVTRAEDSMYYDKQRRRTNQKGYLIDTSSLALVERYS